VANIARVEVQSFRSSQRDLLETLESDKTIIGKKKKLNPTEYSYLVHKAVHVRTREDVIDDNQLLQNVRIIT
jgi:hypothetical protein